MAMHRKLTHKEIKLISDLLDGQLPANKAKQAFLQIEQDVALREAYDKLRWTKSLLRQAPRRKVPHNFALTRQMAKQATGFYKIRRQTFSIAGAMASFLFVVLLAVQLVPLAMGGMLPMAMKSEDIAMMEEAPVPEMMQAAPEEEMYIEEEAMPMEAPAEEAVEEEAFAMEMPEEETVEEDSLAMDAAEEAIPTATLSPKEATGGGALNGETEEELEMDVAEERLFEEEAEPADIEMEIASIEEETEEGISEDVPDSSESTQDWIFLTTVMAGLLAFVFIFISIRDKNRENIAS